MMRRRALVWVLTSMAGFVASAIAQEHAKSEKTLHASSTTPSSAPATNPTSTHDGASAPGPKGTTDDRIARVEGEKRFRTNCGRCHQPPHKFPPRVMAAAIRHMRVRAMITDEDMRLILRYMTQ
jgi:mono/diheme cytochrome c family protein